MPTAHMHPDCPSIQNARVRRKKKNSTPRVCAHDPDGHKSLKDRCYLCPESGIEFSFRCHDEAAVALPHVGAQ